MCWLLLTGKFEIDHAYFFLPCNLRNIKIAMQH